jgi:hypothetical protein
MNTNLLRESTLRTPQAQSKRHADGEVEAALRSGSKLKEMAQASSHWNDIECGNDARKPKINDWRFGEAGTRYGGLVQRSTRIKVSATEGAIGLICAIGIAAAGASFWSALVGGLIGAALIVAIEFLAVSR